jgi:dynein heavy chain
MGKGGAGDDDEGGPPPLDPRLELFRSRIESSLKPKNPKAFDQMFDVDSCKNAMLDFLNSEVGRVVVSCGPIEKGVDSLVATIDPPETQNKKKAMVFMKTQQEVTVENFREVVFFSENTPNSLEHLFHLANTVYFQVLTNTENQDGWPEVIKKDVLQNYHSFLANMTVTIGHTKGKTLLPLPPADAMSDMFVARDKDRVHVLESAVVTWTHQIKGILKADPEAPIKAGLHPGPSVELEFWESKERNLNSIHEQLTSDRAKKLTKVLELTKSTYFPAFRRLCKEVSQQRLEAASNKIHLEPLREHLSSLNSEDFPDLVAVFPPLFHTLLLVWKHSRFYNSPSRVVVLMQEICNDIVAAGGRFVNGEMLFQMEPQEAVDALRKGIKVAVTFKSTYFDYKARAGTSCPSNPWRFQNAAIFMRLDAFLERLHDLLELMQTILQFNKLERVEVGGTKGFFLSQDVKSVFADFSDTIKAFSEAKYEIVDVNATQFADDFCQFRLRINELERRLGSIILTAFDDCTTINSCFKLMDNFEGVLEREIIQAELEKKHKYLVNAYKSELKIVQQIFLDNKDDPPLNDNQPPKAGAVAWCRGLLDRAEDPMTRLKAILKVALDTDEGKEVSTLHNVVVSSLNEFEKINYDEWANTISAISDEKLNMPLLRRDTATGMLFVNFDAALTCLLREVRYFLLLGIQVPDVAMVVFRNGEQYHEHVANMEIISNIYNRILDTLMDVERPLVADKLERIDVVVQRGLTELCWKSQGISDFISEAMDVVTETANNLSALKNNVAQIEKLLAEWSERQEGGETRPNPMMERKILKTYSIDDFQSGHEGLYENRTMAINEASEKLQEYLASSNQTVRVSTASQAWKDYVNYVNAIIIRGLAKVVTTTARYLLNNMTEEYMAKHEIVPLIEVHIELNVPNVDFAPEMGDKSEAEGGIKWIVSEWLHGFINVGTLLVRLDVGDGDYLHDLQEDCQIKHLVGMINKTVHDNEMSCLKFKEQFERYSYLWTDDLQASFQQFMEENSVDGQPPVLDLFDRKIAAYKQIDEDIKALPNTQNMGWLRLDARPVKNALQTWLSKWTNMYQQYLVQRITSSMEELYTFMDNVNHFLVDEEQKDAAAAAALNAAAEPTVEQLLEGGAEPETAETSEVDSETLLQAMTAIRDVRKRTDATDEMFEPLRNTVTVLKKYNVSVSDQIVKQLEESPALWSNVKKKMFLTKEHYSDDIDRESYAVKKRSWDFDEKVKNFRADFRATMPFNYEDPPDSAWAKLDRAHHGEPTEDEPNFVSVLSIEKEAQDVTDMKELFELNTSEYKDISSCISELGHLKVFHDMSSIVQNTFTDWKKTLWNDINVDTLTDLSKQLLKELKGMSKVIKGWKGFDRLEAEVKNMMTSLPLVSELHNPAMRARHWKLLMKVTEKEFTMDEKFSLSDLLALGLHEFVDDVQEIVDRACKELLIEKALKKVEDVWVGLNLTFSHYEEADTHLMAVGEEVIEALEENSLLLQNMSGQKYVVQNQQFFDEVSKWVGKLGNVEEVIASWMDVQKKWQNLQSIFVGSADIRIQLPEDSKRFDGVDVDWRDLMKEAIFIPNVVDACNTEGRLDRLRRMQEMLEKCEKALADYLETKRIAYPRFYFVANADLLDILSKGSNPQAIQKHISKCFDNIQTLEYTKDKEGNFTKQAVGMYSSEKEYITFDKVFMAEGAVELWLKALTRHQQETLRWVLQECLTAYEDKPRTEWLYDFCAQMVIVVARIVFTEEVNIAFEQLEDGNESSLKEFSKKQVEMLGILTEQVLKDLSKNDRRKVITIITVEVHSRDVVSNLISARVENGQCFQWVSQLRYRLDENTKDCMINICDYQTTYGYEYIGNCGCLVITPLTDRCYITLTQAERLVMGGAPAGPAGTGKTETTKDLGRAIGTIVYVFNCSDQMDYKSMGQIYKGLAQAGAWGCFDEFNRIPIEVLSVCSTQWKCILDAKKAKKDRFIFEDEDIHLEWHPPCNAFITMNPGYAGRTELPESLKVLFRPVAMIVPDMDMITEIMLMSEGFVDGRVLARKFMILYRLSEALLSKQDHYDWKLRAVKTTLNVAGGMRRATPEISEDKVLLRALRDFNLGKLVPDDVDIFIGLIGDLFPKTLELVVRVQDLKFEAVVKDAARALMLQPEDVFVLKITQLRELLEVRWSVFMLGPAGAGKTELLKTLARSQNMYQEKTTFHVINPKAVTRNELYGYITSTREWKDGLISIIFRDLANTTTYKHEWIILDGDIDAEWIESMNTVMDDNKMLTLASNERIPLTPPMRLLFEIGNMRNASPATVSRGGVIFLSDTDVGVMPFVNSWVDKRETDSEKSQLLGHFSKDQFKTSLEFVKRNFKNIVRQEDVTLVRTIWCTTKAKYR